MHVYIKQALPEYVKEGTHLYREVGLALEKRYGTAEAPKSWRLPLTTGAGGWDRPGKIAPGEGETKQASTAAAAAQVKRHRGGNSV